MTKFCPECGTEQHSDNNRYCSNCGFDFSKITGNQNNTDFSSSDSINVPITESDESVTTEPKETVSSITNNTKSSSKNKTKSTHTIYTGNNKSNLDGILSNLSFNKCFAAFAIILILLLILGMLSDVYREPYSDDGITSFMENSHQNVPSYLEDSSSGSGLPSFLDDSDSDEDSYDYLAYSI